MEMPILRMETGRWHAAIDNGHSKGGSNIGDGNGNRNFNIDDGKDERGSTIDKGNINCERGPAITDGNGDVSIGDCYGHGDVAVDEGTAQSQRRRCNRR